VPAKYNEASTSAYEDVHNRKQRKKLRKPWWTFVGPGIVSGASDNDPTTVASLSVIGSTTVYGLGWLVLLVIPMLAVVQAISAAVGGVCREGLEDILARHYRRVSAWIALIAILAVNVVTLVADLQGGAAALGLLTGGVDLRFFVMPLAGLSAVMLIFLDYRRIQRVLLVLPLLFLTYAIAAIVAHPNWHDVIMHSLIPHLENNAAYSQGAIALLGTTLTAYAYVWETIELSEERPPLRRLGLVQVDATLGTIVAGISFWFIVVATGATLGIHHKNIATAQDAALALAPFAGKWASIVFGVGLLGSALIAVPVLAATSAYVVAELFGWRAGISKTFWQAPRFFGTLTVILVGSGLLGMLGTDPIKLLFIASIAGGLATPITLFLMMLVAGNKNIMGKYRPRPGLLIAGWSVFAIVSLAAGFYLYQTFTGQNS
jgi:Mn2+/Fe2+ NRAMP family transporter